jgi:hypothetical protein
MSKKPNSVELIESTKRLIALNLEAVVYLLASQKQPNRMLDEQKKMLAEQCKELKRLLAKTSN